MFAQIAKIRFMQSDSSGFTLIELMVALFVFAIGMLAVTAMCLMSIQGNSLVNRTTQANFLAQSRMEELLSEGSMAALDAQEDLAGVNVNGLGEAGVNYLRTVEIAANTTDTRWVTVNVSWTDSKGSHQVELKSLARAH